MGVKKEPKPGRFDQKVCPLMSMVSSVSKKNTGMPCIKDDCEWYNTSCKCCSIRLI